MKFITLIFTLLLSSQAFAHHDHFVSDSTWHMIQHGLFLGLCAVIGYKGMQYIRAKKNNKK